MNKSITDLVFKYMNKSRFIFGLLLGLFSSLVALILPSFLGEFIDGAFLQIISDHPSQLLGFVVLVVVVYFLQAYSGYLIGVEGGKTLNQIQKYTYERLLKSEVSELELFKSGDLASRFTNDMSIILRFLTSVISGSLMNIIMIVGSLFFLIRISFVMTLLTLSILPVLLFLIAFINNKVENSYVKFQETQGDISSTISHRFSHIRLVKSFNGESEEENRLGRVFNQLLFYYRQIIVLTSIQGAVLSSLIMSFIVLIVVVAAVQVNQGLMTVGTLLTFMIYVTQLIEPVTEMSTLATEYAEFRSVASRLSELIDLVKEEEDTLQQDFPTFEISLHEVNFSYADNQVLENVTFKVEDGEHLAIVGPSGAGKSTILSLLLKFYQPSEGTIQIGNRNLASLTPAQIRSLIGFVPQTNTLFQGTIRENLFYGKNKYVDKARLDTVLDALELDKLIVQFPNGLETVVSEKGTGLSEGQKQRFSIARALLLDSPIYLIDEATSNLDSVTESITNQAIENLTRDKTRITIAHRLNTIKGADKILVLDRGGRVVDCGDHETLLNRSELYQDLINHFH
ncbi:ABC transporter ATP-binding protein [Streptococcus danieliae]|uniref:ABC transporter ATP-binding protein n=1 Tax=Streptococcus danieliae TaxID=747656 RepID=A0A7Z0S3X9_9STRE|nr:ABC transporter ATP-binding protein [Streptococcus danieliae]MBF0698781.1 ABC transporter ATP-binding protein [Streptococcus danieliae]NYS95958.1 ABC transporter ATP-binding protein [Streptococcus danieliae]